LFCSQTQKKTSAPQKTPPRKTLKTELKTPNNTLTPPEKKKQTTAQQKETGSRQTPHTHQQKKSPFF
jgi:hypothetical protein